MNKKADGGGDVVMCLGAFLEKRHQSDHPFPRLRTGRCGKAGHHLPQGGIIHGAQVMAVDIGQLVHVESRRGLADTIKAEPADGVSAADDLVIAMAPP